MKHKPKKWIVLDVSYLAWRAFHSTGTLEHQGVRTGVLFGIFRTLRGLQDAHRTKRVVWCFDRGPYKRKEVFNGYKTNPKPVDDEQKEEARDEVRRQIELLRTDYLERLGYRNVFHQRGYEADDIIASVCNNLPADHHALIVSADKDLYQLLRPGVTIWSPRLGSNAGDRVFTRKLFREKFNGLDPEQWPQLKAIAGCSGDKVPGVRGVGEVTAAAHLCGRSVNRTVEKAIEDWLKSPEYVRNMRLVQLPYFGCKVFKPVKDELDTDEWDKLMKELGMFSLKTKEF